MTVVKTVTEAPLQGQFIYQTDDAPQGDGDEYFYFNLSAAREFSLQLKDEPGTGGTNTYILEVTNEDDDSKAIENLDWDDVTNAWFGAASFTTHFRGEKDNPKCKYARIKRTRSGEGGAGTGQSWLWAFVR